MKNKGFSLVEVMVASGLAVGMSLVCALALRAGARSWRTSESYVATSSELRRGIHSMAWELAQTEAAQLEVWFNGAWAPMGAGAHGTGIRFKVPQVAQVGASKTAVFDAAGNVAWSALTITYDLAAVANGSQALQRTQVGAPVSPLILAYGVTALNFRRLAAPEDDSVVEIRITVQRGAAVPGAPTSGELQPVTLSTRIQLRNEL